MTHSTTLPRRHLLAGSAAALGALGLTPGFVGPVKPDKDAIKTYGLNLSNKLNLNDPASIKAAIESLATLLGGNFVRNIQ